MGRISHLIPPDRENPTDSQLETVINSIASLGVINSIATLMANSVADSAKPEFERLLAAVGENAEQGGQSVDDAVAVLQQAIKAEIDGIKPEIKKIADALSSSNRDMVGLQGRLVEALSNVKIPDYTNQLDRLEKSQPDLSPVMKAIDGIEFPEPEERPTEWVFDIERHNNGLIKSVTARAVE